MKAAIKYDKKDAIVFCDEKGHHVLHGESQDIIAIYSSIGVGIKEQVCKTDEDKEVFNHCLETLLTDDPRKTLREELINKLEKVLKEVNKED